MPLLYPKKNKLEIILFGLLLLLSADIGAQVGLRLDTIVLVKKPHLKATVNVLAFNTLINRYDAYFKGGGQDFAKVTFSSMWHNITGGIDWDWNTFNTNWAGHPYHGSLMYNTARTVGLNYWQSVPYAIGGAAVWEFLGETHSPSGSDLITTSIGGIYMGEILFRVSELVLDDRTTGWNRFGRESLGFILNPVGGLNRLVYGTGNDYHPFPNHVKAPVRFQLTLGSNYVINNPNFPSTRFKPYLELGLLYGDHFEKRSTYQPFDIFNVVTWLRFEETKNNYRLNLSGDTYLPYWNIYSYGILTGTNFHHTDKENQIIGIFQHFDYLNNKAFEVSSLGFSGGWIKNTFFDNNWELLTSIQLGGIAFGASNSETIDWIRPETERDMRDYIMGPGLMAKYDLFLNHSRYGNFNFRYGHWTIFVASGPKGVEDINLFDVRYSFPLFKKVNFGTEYIYYLRNADYSNEETEYEVTDKISEIRFFVSYGF